MSGSLARSPQEVNRSKSVHHKSTPNREESPFSIFNGRVSDFDSDYNGAKMERRNLSGDNYMNSDPNWADVAEEKR